MAEKTKPFIRQKEYKKRRKEFAKKLDENSLVILCANSLQRRSNDTEYPYRQNSNFYYLTGHKEDKSYCVIKKAKKSVACYLFVYKKDPVEELWNGKRLGQEGAQKAYMFDDIFLYDEFETKIQELQKGSTTLYYDFGHKPQEVVQKVGFQNFLVHKDASAIIQKMRLYKSDAEIAMIQHAIDITKKGYDAVIHNITAFTYEYQIQAQLEYSFRFHGAYSDAYTSIVASGNNANTLHYIKNDASLCADDMVLIDAGCEYEYYASDITRTLPLSGRFSKEQKELYSIVLQIQKEVIAQIAPGVKRSQLQKYVLKRLTYALVELGILRGDVKKLLKKEAVKKYYPHGIGHWMGLDVHDMAPYTTSKGKEILLDEGMVLTIEPGLYIDKDDTTVPKRYRGIAIRIEDDIVVTRNGAKVLSANIPKEISDLER